MRHALFALLSISLALIILPVSHAYLSDWSAEISLNDDKTTEWTIIYHYNETVRQSDFFLLSGILSYNVTTDDSLANCSIASSIGSSIVCNNLNAKTIVYHVKTFPLIRSLQSLSTFSTRFSITQPTDKFSVIIKLPFGTAFAESSKLEGTGLNPYEPPGAMQKSDGRRIYAEWVFDRPKLGETTDFTVVCESVKPADYNIFLIIISLIIIAFLIFLVIFFKRRKVEDIFPLLTENERKVVEIVLRDKKADQRTIVKETDFSKAKVSRIIHDLEKRGIIEKKQKGRNNIITLNKSKKMKKPESTLSKPKETH